MRDLKIVLAVLVLMGALFSGNAQRKVVKTYPKHGTLVTTVHKPKIVVYKNNNYYYANGIWYRPKGKKYVVCAAPIGIQIRKLPRGNKVVVINGRKLYKYKGIWYKKKGRGYIVVNV
ncbi:DUF6515 family protein [Maribacter sp. 2304DJ31-5]|uniref:DUF6515 family protein n=1 Tax=Maribacter sp. 2304DJ31-5 TaxID=3386273 RepID=UPI0039BC2E33